jgi:DNA invertase Pin-like site-specific DNA recombinase
MTAAAPARVIGYVRVSTDEQAISGLGLADQEHRIREMAKPHGWRIVQMIRDEGLSAGTLERPGLYRALALLAAGRADGLVVAKLDRLTRSTVDFGLLLEWFRDAGRTLVLLDLGVDTSTAGGELVANVIASVAQWERGVISERTRAALGALRAQGKPTGRPAVADDQALATRIRAMRDDEGLTLRQIAARLNDEDVPTMRGAGKWQPSSIQSALGYKRPRRPRKLVELPTPGRA